MLAEGRFGRLDAPHLVARVHEGARFHKGVKVKHMIITPLLPWGPNSKKGGKLEAENASDCFPSIASFR